MFLRNKALLLKILLVSTGIFLLQVFLGLFVLYEISIRQTQNSLQTTVKRIHDDIYFQNGNWNVSRYNSDPQAEGAGPTYILSSDGYVIDRWKPIHGFLDTSDLKHLLSYTKPQTITTPTQQTWRIFSYPLTENGQNLGVITVASFNPQQNTDDVDKSLLATANTLKSKIMIKDGNIDVSNIDVRDINFDIAFQVVDRYNKIIAKNNNTNSIDRIPNFIDLSYVGDLLTQPTFQQINDSQTNERFLFLTSPMISNNTVIGVIVVGMSIATLGSMLQSFFVVEIIGIIFLSILTLYLLSLFIKPFIHEDELTTPLHEVQKITFDKKESTLLFDDQEIVIPYATNQYYLLEALFSNPKKRWETDELLEKFGEHDFGNTRKVYDAMIIVNKKVASLLGTRLVVAREKTYQINPSLLSKIM